MKDVSPFECLEKGFFFRKRKELGLCNHLKNNNNNNNFIDSNLQYIP